MKWSYFSVPIVCGLCIAMLAQISQLSLSRHNGIVLAIEIGLVIALTIVGQFGFKSQTRLVCSDTATQQQLIALLKERAHQDAAYAATIALTGGAP